MVPCVLGRLVMNGARSGLMLKLRQHLSVSKCWEALGKLLEPCVDNFGKSQIQHCAAKNMDLHTVSCNVALLSLACYRTPKFAPLNPRPYLDCPYLLYAKIKAVCLTLYHQRKWKLSNTKAFQWGGECCWVVVLVFFNQCQHNIIY